MGARIGEIEEMCAPLLAASEHPDAEGTRAFRETWSRMADKLCALAGEDEARGRRLSAGEKYLRAANYYLTCERLQAHGAPDREALYCRFLDVFAAGLHHTHANCQRVTIPYEGKPCRRFTSAPKGRPAARRCWCRSTVSTPPKR
jgi:hypothetical protein